MPAEVVETLTPLVQHRRELRTDSGGAGRTRGGLGQHTELSCRSGLPWGLSALIDRTRFAGKGVEGGRDGALGRYASADGEELPPKRFVLLEPDERIALDPPGGAGYGPPGERDPRRCCATSSTGTSRSRRPSGSTASGSATPGRPDALVRTPDMYELEEDG